MEDHPGMETTDRGTDGAAPVVLAADSTVIPHTSSCEATQSDAVPDQKYPAKEQPAQSHEGTVGPEILLPTVEGTSEDPSAVEVTSSSPDASDQSVKAVSNNASGIMEKPNDQSTCLDAEKIPPSANSEEQIDQNMEDISQSIERVATSELPNKEIEENGEHIPPVDDSRGDLEAVEETEQSVNTSLDVPCSEQPTETTGNEQAIASPEPDSQQENKTADLVRPSIDPVPEVDRGTNDEDRPSKSIDGSSLQVEVVKTAQDTPNDPSLALVDTAGPPSVEIGEGIGGIDSVVAGSVSTEEQPIHTADMADSVSAEPMVVPVQPDAEMKDVNNTKTDCVDNVAAGSVSMTEHSDQTAEIHDSTEQHMDATCSVDATPPPPVTNNTQTELDEESPATLPSTVAAQSDELPIVIASVSSAADLDTPTVEPLSASDALHIPHTVNSDEPANRPPLETSTDYSNALAIESATTDNRENTIPDSGGMLGKVAQIKSEESPDGSKIITPQYEQFDVAGEDDGSNDVEMAEYEWSIDQSLLSEGNVSQDYESHDDPEAERSWQGQAMLEVVGCESEDSPYNATPEGELPNLNFCIDSVRGDVPWPLSGSEDEGNDATGTGEEIVDSHGIRLKMGRVKGGSRGRGGRGRRRGKGGVDVLALPYLRRKNSAGTADGYYSLNSNVKGLVAWLSHSKGAYTLTTTMLGYKVVEEPPDTAQTSFICELCNATYTDVDAFLGHCQETRHKANRLAAVQHSLKLYTRQMVARTQARKLQDGGEVVTSTSPEGTSNMELGPGLLEPGGERGGYRGGRRGRGRPMIPRYENRLHFSHQKKLQQPLNPPQPKRGRGRPRKMQPVYSSMGQTEASQPLLNALPFEKTKPAGEEDKRILRVKPLPRQEDGSAHYRDMDSQECPVEDDACDSDGLPPLAPNTALHGTPFTATSSPKRSLYDHSEASQGHPGEPRRKRQRYSTDTLQESDASSTSTSVRSYRRSSRELMDSPRREDHTPAKTGPGGEVIKRGRGRPRKNPHSPKSTPSASPVAQHVLGVSSGVSLSQTLPVPIVKIERTTPEELLASHRAGVYPSQSGTRPAGVPPSSSSTRPALTQAGPSSTRPALTQAGPSSTRPTGVQPGSSNTGPTVAQPGPSSTITSASSFGNEELLNSLTDEQLWGELLERKTVHACTCGYAFSTSSAYYLHKACHNTVNDKTCSFCGLEATNWMMFHAHFFNHKAPT